MNKANIKGFLFSKNTITILLVFAGIILGDVYKRQ